MQVRDSACKKTKVMKRAGMTTILVQPQRDPALAIFATGCLIGMMLSYGNIVGFLAGTVTGVVIQANGPQMGEVVVSCVSCAAESAFTYVRSMFRGQTSKNKEEPKTPSE